MEARGFSRGSAHSQAVRPVVVQTGLAAGLGLILVGSAWPAFMPVLAYVSWLAVAAGVALIAILVLRQY